MIDNKSNILSKISTPYIWINTRDCRACWKCVDNCPEHIIGKTGFLWHKHIVIQNEDNCTGCKKCMQICPNGVFNEIK
ncbi:MAG: 4Fe-4S binding protein [Bacteroidales bacterium]|jgi:2-oxoglutarate ferredoxin oxidoreductase subunit delta|nr:4Fe-4S binding protein [Bacteroidales bacterium]